MHLACQADATTGRTLTAVDEDLPAKVARARARVRRHLGLPELDGPEVARRVRAEGHGVPILILTARADEVDTVVGLDAGAGWTVT